MSTLTHLHLHSHFSTLDGLGKPKDIVARAVELGMSAIRISDHASISAMPELFKEAKEAGIKPILGCEFYVVDQLELAEGEKKQKRHHLSVWPKNWAGVQSVMQQLTLANRQFKTRPRLTWEQALDFKDCFIGTACMGGPFMHEGWEVIVSNLRHAYGADLFVEIMPPCPEAELETPEDLAAQQTHVERTSLAIGSGIQPLVTTDAHYVRPEDGLTHEYLLAIQSGKTWNDPKRWKFGNGQLFIKSQAEVIADFKATGKYPIELVAQGIANTAKLAAAVDVEIPKFTVDLPSIGRGDDLEVFGQLLADGWRRLIAGKVANEGEYAKRLCYEMEAIRRLGYVRYFLIVWDIIHWARLNGIMVGPGRGSAAGALVAYLMDITQLDPIVHGLLFERFLNTERISMPDIDVDFQDDRRGEVFDYIRVKYGQDHVANINTFGKLTIKNAFRDVCRVMEVPMGKVNGLSKQIEEGERQDADGKVNYTQAEAFDNVPELVSFKRDCPGIVEQAKRLDGVIRQQGVHACGICISSRPLHDICAVERRADGVMVTNWDMRECEKFGLLKIDILGLTTLTILNHAMRLLKAKGVDINPVDISLTDAATLEEFSKGHGVGVFQFEASGMSGLLKGIEAKTFAEVTDCTALYRPGPLESGMTQRYKAIAKGEDYEHYEDERLRPILSETKSVVIYQEQVMRIARDLAGFTMAEADELRKIMGKKLTEKIEAQRPKFVEGCVANGVERGLADRLFGELAKFAEYGFNKSHAAAYSVISFWCMYLKVHHPLEFMAAAMSHTSTDHMGALLKEAVRLGIEVRNPDINCSTMEFEIDYADGALVAPLTSIKGIGEKAVDIILKARAGQPIECVTAKATTFMTGREGSFLSVADFQARIYKRVVNSRVVDFLTRAGCFESLGVSQPDPAVRQKDFAELLAAYCTRPKLSTTRAAFNEGALMGVLRDAVKCAASKGNSPMQPRYEGRPAIMVINNPTQYEEEHWTSDSTRYFLKEAHRRGFAPRNFYYTGPVKCRFGKHVDTPKDCAGDCMKILSQEIKTLAPKLIVVCATQIAGHFTKRKPAMAELAATVEYSKEYDAYVLFSYSPQFAAHDDKANVKFQEAMDVMAEIFNKME